MILKFSLVISLVCDKDTDIEALAPASIFQPCLIVLSSERGALAGFGGHGERGARA